MPTPYFKAIFGICLLMTGSFSCIFAQNKEDSNTVVQINSLYKPNLIAFEKLPFTPQQIQFSDSLQIVKLNFNKTSSFSNNFTLPFKFETLTPLTYNNEKPYNPYSQSLKIGYGNMVQPFPFIELNFENGNGKNIHLFSSIFHESLQNNNVNNQIKHATEANFVFQIQKENKNVANVLVAFKNDYFGKYAPSPYLDNLHSESQGNLFRSYLLHADFTHGNKSNSILFPSATVVVNQLNNKLFEWSGEFQIKKYSSIKNNAIYNNSFWENESLLNFQTNVLNKNNGTDNELGTLFNAQTTFILNKYALKTFLGLNFYWSQQNSKGHSFFVFPQLESIYNLLNKKLVFHAGITSLASNNTLSSLFKANPFVSENIHYNTTFHIKLFLALKGEINNFSYVFQFDFNRIENEVFYKTNQFDYKTFSVLYVPTLNRLNLKSELKYSHKFFETSLLLTKSYFTNYQYDSLWGIPDYEIKGKLSWNSIKKLKIVLEYQQLASNWYLKPWVQSQKINFYHCGSEEYFGLDANFEYLLKPNFKIWFGVHNILNKKNERWGNYMDLPINFLGGFQYQFRYKALFK